LGGKGEGGFVVMLKRGDGEVGRGEVEMPLTVDGYYEEGDEEIGEKSYEEGSEEELRRGAGLLARV
jgi:hypothetical protein